MIKSRVCRGAVALLSLIVLASCAAGEGASNESALGHTDATLSRAQPQPIWRPMVKLGAIGLRTDLSADHVVGLVPSDGRCPVADGSNGWEGGALFGNAAVPPEPPLSGRFCAYRRVKVDAAVVKLPRYCPYDSLNPACSGPSGEAWLEPTARGVMPLGLTQPGKTQIASALRARFKAELGLPQSLPRVPSSQAKIPALPARTTIWLLDDAGEHSKAVMQTALASACTDDACSLELRRSNVFGDSTASASALTVSRGIFEAVEEAKSLGLKNLVFNASFGIHPALMSEPSGHGVVETRPMYLAYEALKAAINYAACSDYLFVSAIGNRDGGEDDRDVSGPNPMYPGGWAHDKRAWACQASQTVKQPEKPRPIVVAAGAVNSDGSDSMTTRVNGQAELVTPGFAVPLDQAGEGKLYWEGSSFSSAALSGVLALVWSYLPGADAQTILDLVYDNALSLQRQTRLCRLGAACDVRRVRLCETVQAALRQATFGSELLVNPAALMSCATVNASTTWTHVELDPASRSALDDGRALSWAPVEAVPSTPECGGEARAASELERAPYSCPFETLGSGQSSRQVLQHTPPGNGCPVCNVALLGDNDVRFIGALDPKYLPIVSSPVLRVRQVSASTPLRARASGTGSEALPGSLPSATVEDRLYELSGLLDATPEEMNLVLDTAIGPNTQKLEVMLEYVMQQPGGEPVAQGIPIAVLDLR